MVSGGKSQATRILVMVLLNVVLLSTIAFSASLSSVSGESQVENSIVYHLIASYIDISSSNNTLVFNLEATGSVYLIKNATEVRSNASVTCEIPLLNESKTMTETSTGVYSTQISERFTIASESPDIDVRNFKIVPEEIIIRVNGIDKYNSHVDRVGDISVSDFIATYEASPDISITGTIGNVEISNLETMTYEIPVEIIVKQQILNNGVPLANATLTYSLPDHDYSENVTTNADGVADVHITETVLITISGGEIVELEEPIVLPSESDVIAFWWPGPSPEKEQRHLSITVSTDQAKYRPGDNVHISGKVTDEKGGVGGATVSLTIKKTFVVYTASTTTASDGTYSFDYKIPITADAGGYVVKVKASKADTDNIDYHDSSTESVKFKVISHPKIKKITYEEYLKEYKDKWYNRLFNNYVFNRGKSFKAFVWLEDFDRLDRDKHHVKVTISDPAQCTATFEGWTTEWWGLRKYNGARFKIDIPSNNPVGEYKLEAKLYYKTNYGADLDLSQIEGGKKIDNFYVIFNPDSTGLSAADKASYVYGESTNKDEIAVYFTAEEEKPEGRWMGKVKAESKGISPFSDSKFKMVIDAIQGETSEQSAVVKIKNKVRSQFRIGFASLSEDNSTNATVNESLITPIMPIILSPSSLDYAVLMTELSRSAGIPARIATVDANEGKTGRSMLQITEVYINGEWQVVDAYNDVGPLPRLQIGSRANYNEENNDDIFIAKSYWNSNYVGDWWRGPW